ncbi:MULTISPECIES: NHLP bacteriocin system secretion protein [Paenibacillus]|uniref:NHLP bacteriocin system secretion protein n=1 Tax=Paenibacillus TaxID=44249 RepID=UPI0002E8DE90|nr:MULTISPECIES: NHLP bacteriocin system secretion protein [Paenibacillus]APO43947.1 NHLP bacteriocin system secretion protein [Paenibacillus xylanexedens]
MNKQVFRKVALERLSSPEQLDNLVRVTSPRGWLMLIGAGLILAAALYWGIFGTMTTRAEGQGVLIRPGGLKTVHTSSEGAISDIAVVENDTVQQGEVIGRIEQPALLDQIRQTKLAITNLQSASSQGKSGRVAELGKLKQQQEQQLLNYEYQTQVVSPYTGKVTEVLVKNGMYVGEGTEMFRMETYGSQTDELIGVMYVPVNQGKQLLPGMEVRVSPSTVNREEYGSMIGQVVSVSEFPVTVQELQSTLGNEGLVEQMASQGLSLEVRVNLSPNSELSSGYNWTTKQGPPVRLNSGMTVDGTITVHSQRPIATVIPYFK